MVVLDLVWTTDPGNSSAVGKGEEAFKTGENMGGAVKYGLFIKFDECSFHKIKRKFSKYCHMGLKLQPTFAFKIKHRSLWEDYLVVCPQKGCQLNLAHRLLFEKPCDKSSCCRSVQCTRYPYIVSTGAPSWQYTVYRIYRISKITMNYRVYTKKEKKNVNKTKFLGVLIDENLTWKDHIDEISKTMSQNVGMINKLKHFVPKRTYC